MNKLLSVGLAMLFSFSLFVLMTLLIDTEAKAVDTSPYEPVTFAVLPEDLKMEIPPRKYLPKEAPEEVKLVKTPDLVKTTPEKTTELPAVASADHPTLGPQNPNGKIPVGVIPTGMIDGDLLGLAPKIRIEPQYPREAAIDGIQGYVTLKYDVNEYGEATNIMILEADPKGYFEQVSKQALRKWKFDPKKEQGVAVAALNQTVTLDFKLADN